MENVENLNNINNQKNDKPRRVLIGRALSIIIAVIGLIIIISIVIGGALLASKRWDPKWNPFRQKDPKASQLIRINIVK